MLITLWGSPEEVAEPFVVGCPRLFVSPLISVRWLRGQEGRVEFIKILKGKGRAVLNIASQRLLQPVLNWVCLLTAHVQRQAHGG